MFIGDLLIAHKLVTAQDVAEALEEQKTRGGRLGEILIAMGKLKGEDLDAVLRAAPSAPTSLADTDISASEILNLILKTVYSGGGETASAIANVVKLPHRLVQDVLNQAQERKLMEALGASSVRVLSEFRFALTEKGKQWALEALDKNQYIGPAPVSLEAYCDQIERQRITGERVDREAIERAFSGMAISGNFIQQIGPAINSGRSILLYGPPGNGKTSVAERIGAVFRDIVYIPHCIEVEGQIIKVFDPGVHQAQQNESAQLSKGGVVRREDFDARWVACRRPFVVAGGELTLEMLDLSFNPHNKFYEAPLHVKALGGIFMIDDFGRQLVSPEALLNRWIVPLERRVDYLKLHSGKSFLLPFDELVIFSTNLSPRDLMDPAFLRRIPYKLQIESPDAEQFRQIFTAVAKSSGIAASNDVIEAIIASLRDRMGMPLAGYQPKFILDQILAACKFAGTPPALNAEFLQMALSNLSVENKDEDSTKPVTLAKAA